MTEQLEINKDERARLISVLEDDLTDTMEEIIKVNQVKVYGYGSEAMHMLGVLSKNIKLLTKLKEGVE
jgi:hypothetical protein